MVHFFDDEQFYIYIKYSSLRFPILVVVYITHNRCNIYVVDEINLFDCNFHTIEHIRILAFTALPRIYS